MHRVFFALWPSPALADQLVAQVPTDLPGLPTDPASVHMTLAFIGQVDAAGLQALLEVGAAQFMRSFSMRLDQLNFWRHNHILWAGCTQPPAPLLQLASDLSDSLRARGFALEDRPFAPHITLMRKAQVEFASKPMAPLEWAVDSFCLAESQASAAGRYRIVRSWPAGC